MRFLDWLLGVNINGGFAGLFEHIQSVSISMTEQERSADEPNQSFGSSRQESYRVYERRKERKTAHYKKPCRPETTNYYWSDRENRSYLRFLIEKGALLSQTAVERKKQKTNLKLSKYIKTRTPTQCHTHHQKMMVKYGSIEAIIAELVKKFQSGERGRGRNTVVEQAPVMSGEGVQLRCGGSQGNKNTSGQIQWRILKEQNDLQYIYY